MADALICAGRILRVGSALALDRAHVRGGEDLPFSLSELSAPWLSRTLGSFSKGVRVGHFERLERHSGTTTRARIALDYLDPGERGTLPRTLFIKIAPRGLAHRIFLALTGIGLAEVRFYRDIRAGLPIRSPFLYAAECSGAGRNFVLLLEDLVATGARFASVGDRATLAQAQQVVDSLARLHAGFQESPRFEQELAWLPCFENRRARMPWERFVSGQMIARAERRFAHEFPADFGRIASLCRNQRDGLEALWARGARTLVHGDCHLGNLFFEKDGIGFFDWQVCGRAPGLRDVSYFLCNSLPTRLRREHESALIDRYREQLGQAGGQAPSREEAWAQHRVFAVYTWLAAAFTAAAGSGLQPPEIALAGLRRSTQAAIDLGSVAAIERDLGM